MHILLLVHLWLGLNGAASMAAEPTPAANTPNPKATRYQIPYRLTETQHVLVRVKLNGKGPFNFIIDTGAPALILNEGVGKQLKLKTDRGGWTTFDRFELEGGLTIPKTQGLVLDMFQLKGMNGMGLAGVELHGVIGYNLLAQFRIQYDFTDDKLVWIKLDYNPPPIQRISKGGSQGGLEALGSVMGFFGSMLGRSTDRVPAPRGYLGVELNEDDGKVFITKVLKGSPAAKAGIQPGDRIEMARTSFIDRIKDLERVLASLVAGKTIPLVIQRDGERQDITIELGKGF